MGSRAAYDITKSRMGVVIFMVKTVSLRDSFQLILFCNFIYFKVFGSLETFFQKGFKWGQGATPLAFLALAFFALLLQTTSDGDHDGALHALAEEVASVLVDALDRARGVIGVCGATARAVKTCPAIAAFGTGVDVAGGKLGLDLGVVHTVKNVTQLELFLANELVAGIEIAPGSHGHILGSRATARDALVDAGAAFEVDHVVVEGKGLALTVLVQHEHGQLFVLLHDDGTSFNDYFILCNCCSWCYFSIF